MSSRLIEGFHSWSAAWGAWMWSMSWQVALVVVVVAVLTRLLRQRSAVTLHALWLLILVRLVLPPSFALPTGWGWWCLPARQSAGALPETTARPAGVEMVPSVEPSSHDDREPIATAAADSTFKSTTRDSAVDDSRKPTGPLPAGPAEAKVRAVATDWVSYLMLAWLGVTGTLLCLLAAGTVRVWNWVLHAEPLDDVHLYRLVESCRRQLHLHEPIELRNSDSCTTPVVVGIVRPVILLPKAVLVNLTTDEVRAVLMHELIHVARKDAIVNLVQGVLGAVYFFHPLVWWANSRLRELREEACDELTIAAMGGERKIYGEAIVKVTEIFGYASPPLALGVMESKNPAHRRLSRILDNKLPAGERLGWRGLAALCVLGAVLLPSAGAYPPENPAVTSGSSPVERPAAGITSPPQPAHESPASAEIAGANRPARGNNTDASPATPATPDEPRLAPLGLRYRWQANQRYAFTVEIQADRGDEIETLSGTPTYLVRNNHSESTQLVFNGRLASARKPKHFEPFHMRPPHIPSPFSRFGGLGIPSFPGEDVLSLNDRGVLQSACGDSQLPYLLGNLSQLAIDPLPDDDADKWETSQKSTITLLKEDERFPRRRFGPFTRESGGEQLEAREKCNYRLVEISGALATIVKTTSLTSTQMVDGKPRIELTGETRITFDVDQGLPRAIEGKLQLIHTTATSTHRVPINVAIRQVPPGEQNVPAQQSAAPQSGFGLSLDEKSTSDQDPREPARLGREPLDDAALDQALADLKSTDAPTVQGAARKLERAAPQSRQAEVARALESRLHDDDQFTRQEAARALVEWCDKDSVPVLIAALDDEFFTVPFAAIEGLGKLGDARAAAPLVGVLKAGTNRDESRKALEQIGSAAEIAVVAELLADDDSSLREEACRILKSIGTKRSVEALEQLANSDGNARVERAAAEAVEAIKSRM